jgi:hypothetical protein
MAEEVQGEVLHIGTELEDAAKAWGKDLALESGEEPEDEDNQTDPEEVPEDEPEEEEQQEELEEEEEDEEAESNAQKFQVRSDGEDLEVSLDELISGYSRQSSFTKKSQSLAEDKKGFENEIAESREMRAQALQILENAKSAQTQAPEKDANYWTDLKDTDPMQFMLERDAVREEQFQDQMREQQIQTLRAQEDAEQRSNLEKYVDSQKGVLKELVPEWGDKKVADAEKKLILEYGLGVGFDQKELDQAFDARAVATMRKAALYDQLTAKRKGLKPIQRTNMKGGSQAGDPKQIRSGKASARLKKSGSVDDAASVFYNMIRQK